jgi:hypothetical protein
MVRSFKVQVRQVLVSKTLGQNVGAPARFSAGISVPSPEGQKETFLYNSGITHGYTSWSLWSLGDTRNQP